MKSPFSFLVKAYNERRYDNIKKVGGIDLVTSVSKEDHVSSNRFAVVEETPINYCGPIKKGDTLLVHHNVFKYYYDMRGREKSGKSFLKTTYSLLIQTSSSCISLRISGGHMVSIVLSNLLKPGSLWYTNAERNL